MTKYNKYHPKSVIERRNIPRAHGGRRFIDIKEECKKQTSNLKTYFHSRTDHPLHIAIDAIDKSYTPLQRAIRSEIRYDQMEHIRQKRVQWSSKQLHGRHPNMVQQQHVNTEMSYLWLLKGELYAVTKGFAVVIQDQVISTRNYKKYILKQALDSDKCRKCHQMSETIDHITSGCPILASKHDIAKIIHSQLAFLYGLAQKIEPNYKCHPSPLLENGIFKLYYNNPVLTDKTVNANRPDLILI
ncbi:hypothetical protein ILUMI_24489 [Ignelater luminosus]|uniref:Reverse transcriptase n=1 Tax=Ignelater luminosus TaxID=2038154 RepID=A0A8K0G0Y1_IGNLU|nr:hypothetical protein ILUMI_24489 [Ignelater luminosus]